MGLIQEGDRRPRDWTYLAEFSQDDLPALQEMVKHINETHDVETIELFNSNCERVLHDLKGDYGAPIPNQVVKTDDLVVNAGLQQCINIIIGTSSVRWRYMAIGELVVAAPTISDTAMAAAEGTSRVDISANGGWREAVGMKLFFGAIVGHAYLKGVVRETGIFNTQSGPTMLNHNVFNNNFLSRSLGVGEPGIYKSLFIISNVVEFCPVA